MKFLIIHNRYGKFSGEERVVENQSQLLESKGHQVIHYQRGSDELVGKPIAKIFAFFTALFNTRSIKELKVLMNREKPDVILIHNLYPLISPAILPFLKKFNVSILMIVHNYRLICPNGLLFSNNKICESCLSGIKELNCILQNCEKSMIKSTGYALRNFWARILKLYKNNIDAYLCLTQFQGNILSKQGLPKNKLHVLPNFFSMPVTSVPESKLNRENYIAFVGRLSAEKGVEVLFEAAKKLPGQKFKVAGANRDDHGIHDIPENVELVGFLNGEQLDLFYKKAQMLIMTSIWYETFGLVLLEAMSRNTPVIAPKISGIPEIIEDHQCGLLFEPGNGSDLAEKISYLQAQPELASSLSDNGAKKVSTTYSEEKYYNELLQIINKVSGLNEGVPKT